MTQVLFDYLKIVDNPEIADAIFVLGGSTLEPVEKAYDLYTKGYAPVISFIGTKGTFGENADSVSLEHHEEYRQTLLKKGNVPESVLLSQGIASNTLTEAQAAIPFLKQHGINPKTILLVARPVHQRRAFATFKKQHPEVRYINCPADEIFDLQSRSAQERMVGEVERLVEYSKKGDLEKQEIPEDVLKAVTMIQMELSKKNNDFG